MYKITFFITKGTIQAHDQGRLAVLKRLISQLEEQTNQNSFILSNENELVQNDTEDEEETALKTAEV